MLKAILFDLDDTLIDWRGFRQDWPTFEIQYLRRVFDFVRGAGVLLDDFDVFVESFRERTREGWRVGRANLLAPNLGAILLQTVEALSGVAGKVSVRDCLDAYQWKAVPGTVPFPEVPDMLNLLRQKGVRLAIVTNAYQPMWIRDVEMSDHGLLEFFPDCRISAADVGYLKPHPAIFQAALDGLGVTPPEAVFVGDNPVADIAGAQSAGLQAVLRVTTPMPPMLSGLIVPDAAINSLTELPAVLDEWHPGWRDN